MLFGFVTKPEMSDQQKLVQIAVAAQVHAKLATFNENWCKLGKTG